MITQLAFDGLDNADYPSIRSEDIRFSPSGRTLAIVATNGILFLMRIDVQSRPIRIEKVSMLRAAGLAAPHGVDFIGEHMLVVANRGGCLTFYRMPRTAEWPASGSLQPFRELSAPWFGEKGRMRPHQDRTVFCGPGSVRVFGRDMYVCCNNQSTLSIHPFVRVSRWLHTGRPRLMIERGLSIPDGIAISRDGRWIAVGDHENRQIAIHAGTDPEPRCILMDPRLQHPHGLTFAPGANRLFVADAGLSELHVFETPDGWASDMKESTVRVSGVDEDALQKTKDSVADKYKPLEGGLKGIDLDRTGRILAATCQNQLLRFFDVSDIG